jgi:hypothetical protein
MGKTHAFDIPAQDLSDVIRHAADHGTLIVECITSDSRCPHLSISIFLPTVGNVPRVEMVDQSLDSLVHLKLPTSQSPTANGPNFRDSQ